MRPRGALNSCSTHHCDHPRDLCSWQACGEQGIWQHGQSNHALNPLLLNSCVEATGPGPYLHLYLQASPYLATRDEVMASYSVEWDRCERGTGLLWGFGLGRGSGLQHTNG